MYRCVLPRNSDSIIFLDISAYLIFFFVKNKRISVHICRSFCVHNTCLAIHYMCHCHCWEWSIWACSIFLSFFLVIGHRFNGNKPFYKLIFLNIDFLMKNNLYLVKFLVNMSKWLFHSRTNCNRKCLYATIVKFKILEF